MVNPIQVSTFTPVVEDENKPSISALAAIYLSPLLCNKEIAVIIPGAIDAAGNQDCHRKELSATLTGTILKIVSYILSLGILPALAILINLAVRCNTNYQYSNAPQLQIAPPLAPGGRQFGQPAQPQPAQAPLVQEPQTVEDYVNSEMSDADLLAAKEGVNTAQRALIDEAIRRRGAQQPAAMQPPAQAPQVQAPQTVEDYVNSEMSDADLLAVKEGANTAQKALINEAIRIRAAQQPAAVQPPAQAPQVQAPQTVEDYVNSAMSDDDLLAVKEGANAAQKALINEAIRRRNAHAQLPAPPRPIPQAPPAVANPTLLIAPTVGGIPPAPVQADLPAPQAAPALSEEDAVAERLSAMKAFRATFKDIDDPEALRAIYSETLDESDQTEGGLLYAAYEENLKALRARARELGIDLEQPPELEFIQAKLKEFEGIKGDIEKINLAYLNELRDSNHDTLVTSVVDARLANIAALVEYARALGKELPLKRGEEPTENPTPAAVQPIRTRAATPPKAANTATAEQIEARNVRAAAMAARLGRSAEAAIKPAVVEEGVNADGRKHKKRKGKNAPAAVRSPSPQPLATDPAAPQPSTQIIPSKPKLSAGRKRPTQKAFAAESSVQEAAPSPTANLPIQPAPVEQEPKSKQEELQEQAVDLEALRAYNAAMQAEKSKTEVAIL